MNKVSLQSPRILHTISLVTSHQNISLSTIALYQLQPMRISPTTNPAGYIIITPTASSSHLPVGSAHMQYNSTIQHHCELSTNTPLWVYLNYSSSVLNWVFLLPKTSQKILSSMVELEQSIRMIITIIVGWCI